MNLVILSNFSDSLNAFLKNNALYIALALVALIVITFVGLLIFNAKFKNKK